MAENAARLGEILREELSSLDPAIATTIRGKGLLFAVVIKPQGGEGREGRRGEGEVRREGGSEGGSGSGSENVSTFSLLHYIGHMQVMTSQFFSGLQIKP